MPDVISSRTPEGWPTKCPVCGAEMRLLFSLDGDATCPTCGSLVWRSGEMLDILRQLLRERLAARMGVAPEKITDEAKFTELGVDSLEQVELVMELEEDLREYLGLDLPDDAAENIQSLADLYRYLAEQERKKREEE